MSSRQNLSKIKFWAMGTNVSANIIQGDGDAKEESAETLSGVKEIFENNEKIFSRFKADSELSKLNCSLGKEINVSEEMLQALDLCIRYSSITDGYFDPRIICNLEKIGYDKNFRGNDFNTDKPIGSALEKCDTDICKDIILNRSEKTILLRKRIDVAGVVKGHAVDKAADYLIRKGFNNFIVEAGGDIFAKGSGEKEGKWIIDVEGVNKGKIMLKLNSEGIATSGIGRRRWRRGGKKVHHLINPKDPENFSQDLKAVTVISKNTAEADVLAKSLFLMGKESGMKFADSRGIKALFLDYKGNAYLTQKINENILVNKL